MTNHWIDLQHCKTILVEGSNVAENHPMAYKWIRKAQEENGAKIIHVDPRFTRTSAGADMYARIRPGTDAAFLNTMINYVLVHKLYDEDFVKIHTNALFLGHAAFGFNEGVFSGFDEEKYKYDTSTWGYQLDAKGQPRVAASLDDPHCVFSYLKNFVSRYTLPVGQRITGVPAAQIQQNFAAGVGQKYYLLFGVSSLTGVNQSYVLFTASQYDNYSYLFAQPKFISLDQSATVPPGLPLAGIRLGVNGALVGAGHDGLTEGVF